MEGERERDFDIKRENGRKESMRPENSMTVAGLLEGTNLSHLISRLGVFLHSVNLC